MSLQNWFCDSCKKSGAVRFTKHAGVWEVAEKVRDAHRKASPTCITDPRVRVEITKPKKRGR